MCGRFTVNDDPFLTSLCETLQIPLELIRKSDDVAPGATISIIREQNHHRLVSSATWWLFLDRHSLKPNYKYASFNSRSDKLHQLKSLAYQPYRQSRCIIPASSFVEGLGDKKNYFQLQPESSAIAFGGLYKEWLNHDTGEILFSSSIITLPPCEQLKDVHPKSMPLMLPLDNQAIIDSWLDPHQNQVELFEPFLLPCIHENLVITPIDRPSKKNPIGKPFILSPNDSIVYSGEREH